VCRTNRASTSYCTGSNVQSLGVGDPYAGSRTVFTAYYFYFPVTNSAGTSPNWILASLENKPRPPDPDPPEPPDPPGSEDE
jgi:hypothetical protein